MCRSVPAVWDACTFSTKPQILPVTSERHAMIELVDVTFRALADVDLPMLYEWLNEPGVVRWWEGQDVPWGRRRPQLRQSR